MDHIKGDVSFVVDQVSQMRTTVKSAQSRKKIEMVAPRSLTLVVQKLISSMKGRSMDLREDKWFQMVSPYVCDLFWVIFLSNDIVTRFYSSKCYTNKNLSVIVF